MVAATRPIVNNAQFSSPFRENFNLNSSYQQKMKFIQLNACSFDTSQYLINDYVKANSIEIICISETWEIK